MTYGDLDSGAFNSCNNNELDMINDGVSVNETSKRENNFTSQKFSNLCDKDIDSNLPNMTCCEDYSVNEFQKIRLEKSFNVFHNNINGLESKFDSLHNFLANNSTDFDVIAITETSEKVSNENFLANINIDGYLNFSMPTKSNKGGTSIYVKKKNDIRTK